MQQSRMGSFTWGYFGGLMDAAGKEHPSTGPLYIGNGKYKVIAALFLKSVVVFANSLYRIWAELSF